MVDYYSVSNYSPFNTYLNYGYNKYPMFRGNNPKYGIDTLSNTNYLQPQSNLKSDVTAISTDKQLQADQQKQQKQLSTGAKIAIGAGIATVVAVSADFLFCKGKHVKSLFGKNTPKTPNNGTKPNNTTPKPINTNTTTSTPSKPQTTTSNNVENTSSTIANTNKPNNGSQSTNRLNFRTGNNPHNIHRYNLYNRTPEELKKECKHFKDLTGAELHVPDTMASENFGTACSTLEWCAKDGNFPKDIKHVLVGHGYGSSVDGTWSITGKGGNVFDYIATNPMIEPGDKILVLCCESGKKIAGQNAVGDSVILSLTDSLHPAKVVVAGNNKVAGEFYIPRLFNDDTKPVVFMYPDKPLFSIKKK